MTLAGLRIPVFARGNNGVPSSLVYLHDLAARASAYEHTIVADVGFESMRISFTATVEEALDWLGNGLMRSTVVTGPDGDTVWEGYLDTVEAQFGQERRSVSLDKMANRVRVRYTNENGTTAVTATASDTASQALYGVKDLVVSATATTAAAAAQLRDRVLAQYKNPVAVPSSAVTTGNLGDVAVDLLFHGWAATLDWVVTSDDSTTNTSTTTQVGTLLGLLAGTNSFISTATADIVASGVNTTEFIPPETTYRQKIEQLLGLGNSSDARLAWGVYEGRKMYVTVWAGAAPATIAYQRRLGDADVYSNGGGIIAPWLVRPDRMYQTVELLDPGPISTQADAAARNYVERVVCSISNSRVGVTLETQATESLDALLARLM